MIVIWQDMMNGSHADCPILVSIERTRLITIKEMMMEISLRNGNKLPMVGFGTYLIRDEDAHAAVLEAIRTGYRHIDTAELYRNEKGVGSGLRDGLQEAGLSRDEMFVTTKLWPGDDSSSTSAKTDATTIDSLNASLERLQMEYVDLYLIHAPLSKQHRLDQWKALVDLQQQGKARAIGVSNYNIAHIEEIRAAGLPLPDANQIELHPWSQKTELVNYLNENSIAVIAYSSLVPLSTWRVAPGQRSAKTDEMREAGEPLFNTLAQKYGVSEAQILLKWALQKGYAILPKSTDPQRIRQNFDLFGFQIDDADMTAIAATERGTALAWAHFDPVDLA